MTPLALTLRRLGLSALPLLVGLSVACGADKDTTDRSGTTQPADPDPDPEPGDSEAEIVDPPEGDYVADASDDTVPDLDVEAITAAVDGAIAGALQVHGGPAVASYYEALAGMDASCPVWGVDSGTPFWFDSCTSATGTTFDGYGYQYEYVEQSDGDVTWTGHAIYSVASITGPSGEVFRGAGGANYLTGVNEAGFDVWYSYVQPGFAYDGDAADGTWLADGVQPDVVWYALRDPVAGGAAASFSGTAQVAEGPVAAIVFTDILLIDEAWGSSCPIEPSGSLSVLDHEGNWIDLYFDGPEWEGSPTPEALCDGCGAAWYRGTYLGEACFDFSPMSDWEAYPFADQ